MSIRRAQNAAHRGLMRRARRVLREDRGSSPVEFVLVGTLLTALTLAVLQLALAMYVRNVVHDAAVEGAHHAALADVTPGEGIERARQVITRAVGASYAEEISVASHRSLGVPTIEISVRTTLPLFGLIGIPDAVEVSGRAPIETFED